VLRLARRRYSKYPTTSRMKSTWSPAPTPVKTVMAPSASRGRMALFDRVCPAPKLISASFDRAY
jgi:hypothetical protein